MNVTMCDRPECVTHVPVVERATPPGWVQQAGRLYCSQRCAVLTLGGVWPDDPVTAAYEAALAGEPVAVDGTLGVRVEVMKAIARADIERRAPEPEPEVGIEPEPVIEPDPVKGKK